MRAPTRSLPALALLIAACGGSNPPPADPPPVAAVASSSAAAPPDAPAAASGPRDPKLDEMARAARACATGEKVWDFDSDCAGYKAWRETDDAFGGGKGDDTVLSLLGDPDPRYHYLAMPKTIQPSYWKDKAHAKTLFALARAETIDDVLGKLADYVALVDADAAGLGSELKDLAKHPSKTFRKELAVYLIRKSQTPLALEVEQILLADPEKEVKEQAIASLTADDDHPPDAVCQILAKQITRTDDDLYAVGISAGTSTACPGLRDKALAELDKRTADLAKLGVHEGLMFASSLTTRCLHNDISDAERKKVFALGVRLTDIKVPDSMIRERALDTLFVCDWAALQKQLPRLRKDARLADRLKGVEDSIKERIKEQKASKKK
jgi:hypothetical protein